jgi:hypothetical protein
MPSATYQKSSQWSEGPEHTETKISVSRSGRNSWLQLGGSKKVAENVARRVPRRRRLRRCGGCCVRAEGPAVLCCAVRVVRVVLPCAI